MALVNYTNLLAKIAEYLARDDLTLAIPDFVRLSEAKFNRELFVRQMEQRSTTTFDITGTDPEFISLPADFQSMRSIRISSITGKPRVDFATYEHMDQVRLFTGDVANQPMYFNIVGSEIEFCPTPDQNYTIEMVYRKNIPALADSDDGTNWLLTLAPDIYLYGALLEAAPYTNKDERIQTWGLGFTTALDGLNKLGLTSTYNAGPLQIRPSGVTP